MNHYVKCSCQIKASKVGAKGFHYPINGSNFLKVKMGTQVEILNYLVDRELSDWQAVLIENSQVDGSPIQDGRSVYWIMRKNVM